MHRIQHSHDGGDTADTGSDGDGDDSDGGGDGDKKRKSNSDDAIAQGAVPSLSPTAPLASQSPMSSSQPFYPVTGVRSDTAVHKGKHTHTLSSLPSLFL